MTAPRSVNSSIEVAVDPATAFKVFTEELDCWWIQGPINFFDTARAYYKRMEPGVGGRIVEVYDEKTGVACTLTSVPPALSSKQMSISTSSKELVHATRLPGSQTVMRASSRPSPVFSS